MTPQKGLEWFRRVHETAQEDEASSDPYRQGASGGSGAKRGDSRDIDDFFADFEASHGISG